MNLRAILSRYGPPLATACWTPLGPAGGFSGARVWRGEMPDGRAFALKAFPPGADAGQLRRVHWWMAAACADGVQFVPIVQPGRDGETLMEWEGQCWEITSWMPGRADFHGDPSDARLLAAVAAVARIHEAWATSKAVSYVLHQAPCPAVSRRWHALEQWEQLVRSGWRPRFEPGDPIAIHAESAWNGLPAVVAESRQLLVPWLDRPVPLQPCIGDVWHDHILYQKERVSGVIDFAAAKVDHVAADLARLLGSLIPDQPARMEAAISGYRALRPLPNGELVRALDRAGVAASVANWLRRIYFDNEPVSDRNAIANRLAGLARRLL